jgi:hypothetical protein
MNRATACQVVCKAAQAHGLNSERAKRLPAHRPAGAEPALIPTSLPEALKAELTAAERSLPDALCSSAPAHGWGYFVRRRARAAWNTLSDRTPEGPFWQNVICASTDPRFLAELGQDVLAAALLMLPGDAIQACLQRLSPHDAKSIVRRMEQTHPAGPTRKLARCWAHTLRTSTRTPRRLDAANVAACVFRDLLRASEPSLRAAVSHVWTCPPFQDATCIGMWAPDAAACRVFLCPRVGKRACR